MAIVLMVIMIICVCCRCCVLTILMCINRYIITTCLTRSKVIIDWRRHRQLPQADIKITPAWLFVLMITSVNVVVIAAVVMDMMTGGRV